MPCPRCGSDSKPGQKFCAECGLALSTACPNCGTPYEGTPKFCPECGHGLTHAGAAGAAGAGNDSALGQQQQDASTQAHPPTERRFVTVLFADLVGFTTVSDAADPEEIRDLLSRYFEVARQTIERYGGSVEKFIGDAVMAVWGAPVAQEDDAERAVRAALELVDRVSKLTIGDKPLQLRAGVLSGEAAVTLGRIGEGMVAGDLVNTASRLQSVAPPGAVLVGETTQAATSAAVAFEPAGEQLLKGKSAPVKAWRALRVVASVGGGGRDEGLEPPFVGRDEELRLLKDQLHAAGREKKLRMVADHRRRGHRQEPPRLGVGEVPRRHRRADSLLAPGSLPGVRRGRHLLGAGRDGPRRAGIAEGEDADATRDKLKASVAQCVGDPEESAWLEPALGACSESTRARSSGREQLFAAWRTYFERVADKGPVVLVFEDIQWADSGLLDFIEHVLEWTRDKPMLIVTLARPEILERRPASGRATARSRRSTWSHSPTTRCVPS